MNSATDKPFITAVTRQFGWDEKFASALDYASSSSQLDKSRPRSVDVARRVLEMGSDSDTVMATLLSDPRLRDVLDGKRIEVEFGSKIAELTQGVNQLNTLKDRKSTRLNSSH
jgi:GTP pyrophosphokinase